MMHLPLIADAVEFERWLAGAGPAERCIYAQGDALPRFAATAVLAREWAKAGLITLVGQRTDAGWNFIAEKAAAKAGPAVRAQNRFDESPAQSMLRLIRRHVNLGFAAPTLRQLGEIAGFEDSDAGRSATRRCLAQLQDGDLVIVQNSDDGKRRFKLRDGRCTGWLDMRGGK